MFGYVCILIAFYLTINSSIEYRAISFLVLLEFALHKVAYVLGIQLTDFLEYSNIYLAYILIQTVTIYLIMRMQAHLIVIFLIFINMLYNVLTVSQYVHYTYDFYSLYSHFVGAIMICELLYLVGITKYVGDYRRKQGTVNTNHIDKLFMVRNRNFSGGLL